MTNIAQLHAESPIENIRKHILTYHIDHIDLTLRFRFVFTLSHRRPWLGFGGSFTEATVPERTPVHVSKNDDHIRSPILVTYCNCEIATFCNFRPCSLNTFQNRSCHIQEWQAATETLQKLSPERRDQASHSTSNGTNPLPLFTCWTLWILKCCLLYF